MIESIADAVERARRDVEAMSPGATATADETAQERRLDRSSRLKNSGIMLSPRSVRAVVRAEPSDTHALEIVHEWLGRGPAATSVLVLLGGVGCGKTTAAAWALAELGGSALLGDEVSRLVRSNWSADVDRLASALRSSALLVVDDLGTSQDAERDAQRALYAIVNARQGLPTIITTNKSPEGFREFCEERTTSRLREVGKAVWCKGEDLRSVR